MTEISERDMEEELRQWDDLSEEFGGSRDNALRDVREMLQALRELKAPEAFYGRRSKMPLVAAGMTTEEDLDRQLDEAEGHALRFQPGVLRQLRNLRADVAGDADPGFGYDPKDSEQLLELRQAIDSYLGWKNQPDEEHGDYVFRVREIGDMLWNIRTSFIMFRSAKDMAQILASTLRRQPEGELDDLLTALAREAPDGEVSHTDLKNELDSIDHVLETHGFDSTGLKGITSIMDALCCMGLETYGLDGLVKRFATLTVRCANQRKELRRLNHDARVRAEGHRGRMLTAKESASHFGIGDR